MAENQKKWSEMEEESYSFDDLMEVMGILRGENGCPWDKVQTHESLKNCLIEECYETIEAIESQDYQNLCEEIGDVLLQVAMHTQIAQENREFTKEDMIRGIVKKMIRRHKHVFSDCKADDPEEVQKNWDEIKKEEKNEINDSDGINRVPRALPALMRAQKVQKKAVSSGIRVPDEETFIQNFYRKLNEINQIRLQNDLKKAEEYFGELLFSFISLSQFLQINAENSLTNATDKFINRFISAERLTAHEGKRLCDLSKEELFILWGLQTE